MFTQTSALNLNVLLNQESDRLKPFDKCLKKYKYMQLY